MPTSQSARLRPRAASASGRTRSRVFSAAKPSRIASGVSDEIQSRLDRFVALRRFIDVTENQLTFAPGVGCADNAADLRANSGSFGRLRTDLWSSRRRPAARFGQHRQQIAAPGPPLRPDLVRLSKCDQMTDSPGDDVAVTVQIAVAALAAFRTRAMSRATDGFSATTATVLASPFRFYSEYQAANM